MGDFMRQHRCKLMLVRGLFNEAPLYINLASWKSQGIEAGRVHDVKLKSKSVLRAGLHEPQSDRTKIRLQRGRSDERKSPIRIRSHCQSHINILLQREELNAGRRCRLLSHCQKEETTQQKLIHEDLCISVFRG